MTLDELLAKAGHKGDPLVRVKPKQLAAAGIERVARTVDARDGRPVLADGRVGFAAGKDNESPDKEMLRMMDFLREMEMIKQAEMMQDLSQVERVGDQNSDTRVQQPLPSKRKEAAK